MKIYLIILFALMVIIIPQAFAEGEIEVSFGKPVYYEDDSVFTFNGTAPFENYVDVKIKNKEYGVYALIERYTPIGEDNKFEGAVNMNNNIWKAGFFELIVIQNGVEKIITFELFPERVALTMSKNDYYETEPIILSGKINNLNSTSSDTVKITYLHGETIVEPAKTIKLYNSSNFRYEVTSNSQEWEDTGLYPTITAKVQYQNYTKHVRFNYSAYPESLNLGTLYDTLQTALTRITHLENFMNSTHYLKSSLNDKCLDIRGNEPKIGAYIITWDCHGGANQKFYFSDVP